MTDDNWLTRAVSLKLSVQDIVNGRKFEGCGEELLKLGPRDGKPLYHFGSGHFSRVDQAVEAAREAFQNGHWPRLTLGDRKRVIHRLADLLDKHREELALLECLDVGKPITSALQFDVPHAAEVLRFYAEAADKSYGAVFGADDSSLSYQLRRPVGVIGAIVGWNFPLVLVANKIGPALISGNCVILKPSELTALSASRVAELAMEAGLPEGVFNVVQGNKETGAALAAHKDVDLLSFTGSSNTGKELLTASGRSNMKRLILECGGKAPNIVFDDSPSLEAVANSVIARAFWNQGQVCTASSRLLVQESIKDALMRILKSKASAISPGDPLLPTTTFGAVVSRDHQRRVLQYLDAKALEGASVVYRGDDEPPCPGGFYVAPVLVDGVARSSKLAQDEIFGPVLSVMSFKDEADAIQASNDSIYGLSATVWTRDIGRAHRVTRGIKAGSIVVHAAEMAAGGPSIGVLSAEPHKQSGFGFEGGISGLESYTISTAVQIFS